MNILASASKLVFLALALTACIAFLFGRMEAKDFMMLSAMAFSYYFANKGDQTLVNAGK